MLDPETLEKVARMLSDQALHILDIAAKDSPLDLDLDSRPRLKKTNTGGVYQEPRPLKDLSELPRMRQSEWANPRALRIYRILTGQARKVQRFAVVRDKKKLSVLEDASGSMIQHRLHGLPRFYWSRGKILQLARQARKGQTEFVYRQFNEHALTPISVTTLPEARDFLEWAVYNPPERGGTHIYNALREACADVKEGEKLELLLITDGEDESIDDTRKVKRLLSKGDIRLHVIVIGGENRSLEKVATTYQVVT